MKEYTTGNVKVDLMAQIQLTGNVTPQMWYKTITKENGKPHLLAIAILSDIVYWYRPVEMRDESTGQLIGYRKKFKADMLQRSYDQFADQFGESKRSVTDAVVRLEKLGVIKREFRTLEIGGMKYNNVLFIDLFPEQLCKLTYPQSPEPSPEPEAQEIQETQETQEIPEAQETIQTPVPEFRERGPVDEDTEDTLSQNFGGGVTKFCGGCPEISGEGSQNFGTQNTKNTTENTTKISSSSSDDDADTLKEKAQKEKAGKTNRQLQEYYADALKSGCPPEIVNAVVVELEKYGEPLTPSVFLEVCKTICSNISQHASRDIANLPAYIQKCIANQILMQKLAEVEAAHKIQSDNSFLQQGYGVLDWDNFEQSILSN